MKNIVPAALMIVGIALLLSCFKTKKEQKVSSDNTDFPDYGKKCPEGMFC